MTTSSQRTLFGIDLQLAQLYGENYTCLPNTTLNEKFNILPEVNVTPGTYPTLKYITIGNGGNLQIPDSENFIYNEHSPLDGALFNHIPFVMKTIDSDLSEIERMKYRFRVEKTINDTLYACYYLRVIPSNLYDQKFYKITTVNGENYLKLFKTNDPSILNPVPRTRKLSIDSLNSTEFVTKLVRFKLEFSAAEVKELENVYNILGHNQQLMTEIGLCTGIDYTGYGPTEASCVQIAFHIGVNLDLTNSFRTEAAITKYIELGGSEALIY